MIEALMERARSMAARGVAILNRCTETGNWPNSIRGVDFSDESMTPLALLSPNSRLNEGLELLGITYQDAHDSLLVRRGDIPADVATEVWRSIAGEQLLASART